MICMHCGFPQMWINPCAQVIFDSDPAPKDISAPAGVEMMSQAMIRYIQSFYPDGLFMKHKQTIVL